jgi:hypothetical protein
MSGEVQIIYSVYKYEEDSIRNFTLRGLIIERPLG